MTDDDVRRTMHFILEQQAQLTANVGQLSETVDRLSGTVDRLSVKVDRTADGVNALLAIAEIHEREISANREDIAALKEIVAANSEAGRATDERLNALVNVVEQLISERRGGGH